MVLAFFPSRSISSRIERSANQGGFVSFAITLKFPRGVFSARLSLRGKHAESYRERSAKEAVSEVIKGSVGDIGDDSMVDCCRNNPESTDLQCMTDPERFFRINGVVLRYLPPLPLFGHR
jgi:hypothetical protein